MKNYLLLIVFCSVFVPVCAQFNFGTGGNIGIGNKAPQANLHVGQSTSPSVNRLKITTGVVNESGLVLENLTSDSPVSLSASTKALSVDNTGKVIIVANNAGYTPSYWQLNGNDLLNTNTGNVLINGGFRLGNAVTGIPGLIRFTGSDYQGYLNGQWVSFTGQTAQEIWVSVLAGSNCTCPTGYARSTTTGATCRDAQGVYGSAVDQGQAQYLTSTGTGTFYGWFCVNYIQGNYNLNSKNAQCLCKKL